MGFLTQCLEIMEKRAEAIAYLEELRTKHVNTNIELAALIRLAQLYGYDPQTRSKANQCLEIVVKKFPDREITKQIKERLNN